MARSSTTRNQSPISPRAMGNPNPIAFMQEVISELRKSVWPSKEEVTRLTVVVIALSIAIGFFLGGLDRVFNEIFTRFVF